jgi:protein-disulfide isomerase
VTWNIAKPWLGSVARLALAVVWICACLAKLHSPRTFEQTVRAYGMTPDWLTKAIAYGAPVLMLCLGVVLIIGVMVRVAAAASAVLLLVFEIGMITAAVRSRPVSCACFSSGTVGVGSGPSALAILLTLLLLAAAVFLVLWDFTHVSLDSYLSRHDYVEPPSAKRMRTDAGRRKYESAIEEKRKHAQSRTLYLTSSIALVVVLVSIIGIGVQSGRATVKGTLTSASASPTHGLVYGKAAAATVDLYEDFACQACRTFEQAVHTQLDKDVIANLAQVRFHPIALLDSQSTNDYSSRSANAAMCAGDASKDLFVAYWNVLFGTVNGQPVQPKPGTAGPKNSRLISLAQRAKLTSDEVSTMTSCVGSKQYAGLVQAMTNRASEASVFSVPTVLVNGTRLSSPSASSLFAAIAAADAKGPPPSPSPTPSPTPTVSPSVSGSVSPSPSSSVSPSPSPSVSPSASKSAAKSPSRSASSSRKPRRAASHSSSSAG